ncbi:NnrS family protein [Aquisalimonas lutea]|uniref:NnrS family protein n=1 Tax=Aquisalimonas lutea TaxID=1327750 RepID=UPI0025B36850|nr:NnrS family protein [Aquisalimonas lutea]MDN3519463.1 NnrS family protein [Aquisalimonas lutea]
MSVNGPRSLLAYGFRPFFLLAAAWAMVAPLPWVGALLGVGPRWPMALPPLHWHGHELLFGAFTAALAGFLLTAVPSWTGAAPITGRRLAALVALWLAGRALNLAGAAVPPAVTIAVDSLFLPVLLAALLAQRMPQRPPRDLLAAVAVLAFCPLAAHLALAEVLPVAPDAVLRLAAGLYLVLIAMTFMRILPVVATFAQARAGGPPYRPRPGREALAVASLVAFTAADALAPVHPATGWIALGAAAAQLERLADWPPPRAWRHGPIALLIVVQLWLVAGLVLRGWAGLDPQLPAYAGRHALLIGTMATAVLTVMSIAGLRHTGRPLTVPYAVTAAATLLTVAAALRTAVPLWLPGEYLRLGAAAALPAWSLGWLLWLVRYGRWLLRPRADSLPG